MTPGYKRALMLLVLLLLTACAPPAGSNEDPALAQVEVVARHLTSARHLRNSTWTAVQESKPSALVSFLFSDLGVAEWPSADMDDAMAAEQMRATRTPMFPRDAALVHLQPQAGIGKQLVLSGDDTTGEIVAAAYLDAAQPPVWTHRWPMPVLASGDQ